MVEQLPVRQRRRIPSRRTAGVWRETVTFDARFLSRWFFGQHLVISKHAPNRTRERRRKVEGNLECESDAVRSPVSSLQGALQLTQAFEHVDQPGPQLKYLRHLPRFAVGITRKL